jgi:hypothetical protein
MSLSLQSALQTCKVNTGWANRIQSDRFENPHLMVCPTWQGRDLAGRQVTADSFYTKSAGCNSAEDRVVVENNLRPEYSDYITLDTAGYKGDLYGEDTMTHQQAVQCARDYGELGPYGGPSENRYGEPTGHNVTAGFGGVGSRGDYQCGSCSESPQYDDLAAREATENRYNLGGAVGMRSQRMRNSY